MKKCARTLNTVGSYIGIISILFLMTISVILIGIKTIVESSLTSFNEMGVWIMERVNSSLERINQYGLMLFILSLTLLIVVIFELVLINSKSKTAKNIGNIFCLGTGVVLFWIGVIPFVVSIRAESSATIITGLLFVYTGLSGILMSLGSTVYVLSLFFDRKREKATRIANISQKITTVNVFENKKEVKPAKPVVVEPIVFEPKPVKKEPENDLHQEIESALLKFTKKTESDLNNSQEKLVEKLNERENVLEEMMKKMSSKVESIFESKKEPSNIEVQKPIKEETLEIVKTTSEPKTTAPVVNRTPKPEVVDETNDLLKELSVKNTDKLSVSALKNENEDNAQTKVKAETEEKTFKSTLESFKEALKAAEVKKTEVITEKKEELTQVSSKTDEISVQKPEISENSTANEVKVEEKLEKEEKAVENDSTNLTFMNFPRISTVNVVKKSNIDTDSENKSDISAKN